ncbi:1,4-alpha-glucan branching enzyme GlgB [compost metagenome]
MYRKWHQNDLTFSMVYAFSENFMMPLSHDEVVYGKGSLLTKMPGDAWQKFANLRLLFSYMFTHPGTKLIFMGGEFGQIREWSFEQSLDWHLLDSERHRGVKDLISDLNKLYKTVAALHMKQFAPDCFQWIDGSDTKNCVVSYMRKTESGNVVVVLNLTPEPHYDYRVGVPDHREYKELLNSDHKKYGGSGVSNPDIYLEKQPSHGFEQSVQLSLPPLGAVIIG